MRLVETDSQTRRHYAQVRRFRRRPYLMRLWGMQLLIKLRFNAI